MGEAIQRSDERVITVAQHNRNIVATDLGNEMSNQLENDEHGTGTHQHNGGCYSSNGGGGFLKKLGIHGNTGGFKNNSSLCTTSSTTSHPNVNTSCFSNTGQNQHDRAMTLTVIDKDVFNWEMFDTTFKELQKKNHSFNIANRACTTK